MKNIYEWMCLNVDRIVDAVRKDGGHLEGEHVSPILDECFRQNQPGRSRERARELLKIKLDAAGFKGLVT